MTVGGAASSQGTKQQQQRWRRERESLVLPCCLSRLVSRCRLRVRAASQPAPASSLALPYSLSLFPRSSAAEIRSRLTGCRASRPELQLHARRSDTPTVLSSRSRSCRRRRRRRPPALCPARVRHVFNLSASRALLSLTRRRRETEQRETARKKARKQAREREREMGRNMCRCSARDARQVARNTQVQQKGRRRDETGGRKN